MQTEMTEGTPVRVLIRVADICERHQLGNVTEYPYTGDPAFAFVEFTQPIGAANGYPFKLDEIEKVN